MTVVARCSLADVEPVEAILTQAGLSCGRTTVWKEGMELVELAVHETDEERALAELDAFMDKEVVGRDFSPEYYPLRISHLDTMCPLQAKPENGSWRSDPLTAWQLKALNVFLMIAGLAGGGVVLLVALPLLLRLDAALFILLAVVFCQH
jgi:hypothetical protein